MKNRKALIVIACFFLLVISALFLEVLTALVYGGEHVVWELHRRHRDPPGVITTGIRAIGRRANKLRIGFLPLPKYCLVQPYCYECVAGAHEACNGQIRLFGAAHSLRSRELKDWEVTGKIRCECDHDNTVVQLICFLCMQGKHCSDPDCRCPHHPNLSP